MHAGSIFVRSELSLNYTTIFKCGYFTQFECRSTCDNGLGLQMFINDDEPLPTNSSIPDQRGIIGNFSEIECDGGTEYHVITFWLLINEVALNSVSSVNCYWYFSIPCTSETCDTKVYNETEVVPINNNITKLNPEQCMLTTIGTVIETTNTTQYSSCLRQMEYSSISLYCALIIICYSVII